MKKQLLFSLLFLSWILGISLISIFPPVPDYQLNEMDFGSLSQNSTPEIHQRAASQLGLLEVDLGIDLQGFISENIFSQISQLSVNSTVNGSLKEIRSHFDSLILFKAFFETW